MCAGQCSCPSTALLASVRIGYAPAKTGVYQLDPVTGASTLIGPTGDAFIGGMTLRVLP